MFIDGGGGDGEDGFNDSKLAIFKNILSKFVQYFWS